VIPVNEPLLSGKELENVSECVRTGWVSSAGRFIVEFERGWASYCGRRHGVAVCNGTAALGLAVESLGIGPGDEVILPTFTIISCALAIVRAGATPVLVDCDPATWTMDVAQAAARVTQRTRAIMPVHIYGHPVDTDPVLHLARQHDLAVIEDAAEAHGAEYLTGRGTNKPEWRRCGGFGDVSVFSFYANKIITTGEGGMLLTDDPELAAKSRSLLNLCFGRTERFRHEGLGHNYRMTNLQAALGVAQIERVDAALARKRAIAQRYNERLRDIGSLQLPPQASWARNVYWMYGVVVKEERGLDAATLAARLNERGVETRPFFLGMHEQPAFRKRGLFRGEKYPVAERIARQGLYLPSGLALTDSQIDEVCSRVQEALA
jgi:perosamine synthetase